MHATKLIFLFSMETPEAYQERALLELHGQTNVL